MFINYLIGFFVFIFGLCIGSFLNCFIYRFEQKKNLEGRSFCPNCQHTLKWNDLFPVFSFLFLKGRCRYCKKQISWQYVTVELATGLVFLMLFFVFKPLYIFGIIKILFLFYISSALLIIFIYDLKHYIIPDKVLFPAIGITFLYRLIFNFNFLFFNFIIAAVIACGFFLAVFLITRGRGMGFGDVKLAILMGLLLGMPNIFVALFLAFFLGAIIGVALMVLEMKKLKSEIPFGPFLITGTFITIFWAPQIIQWYQNFFQI